MMQPCCAAQTAYSIDLGVLEKQGTSEETQWNNTIKNYWTGETKQILYYYAEIPIFQETEEDLLKATL